jgi:Zn-dependent protease
MGPALLVRLAPELLAGSHGLRALLSIGIQLNVTLALFNLIPVPPLDGSRVVDHFIPYRFRDGWEGFTRLSPFLLMGVVVFGGRLIAGPANYVLGLLDNLFSAIAT